MCASLFSRRRQQFEILCCNVPTKQELEQQHRYLFIVLFSVSLIIVAFIFANYQTLFELNPLIVFRNLYLQAPGDSMGNANARADAKRYREGYPGLGDDLNINDNLQFYSGTIKSIPSGMATI